jgi:DHA1 family multidrug resistance protein-like MFS transporter
MIQWRRNLYVLVLVQLLATAGFSLVFPFLPLFVKEVGIATRGSVEFWAAMAFSAQAFTMMIASPIWGSVADRRGRKLMLERATIGGALLMAAMGFVQNAEQLVFLRMLQGGVSGVIAAANALVAASTPKEHTGEALGTLNMARWVGVTGGPLVGGLLGEAFGFRESFWITGGLLGLAGLCVVLFVKEDFTPVATQDRPGFWQSYRGLFAAPGMSGLYGLTFLRSMAATLITPIIALFVLSLNGGVATGAAAATGLLIGVAAFTSAVSAVFLGRAGDRIGHNKVLIGCALVACVLQFPQMFVTAVWQLAILQALAGIATGGLVPSTAALMNLWAPAGNQGATYGLDNSVQASARVVAPMLAAAITAWLGYRGVFASSALVYLAIGGLAVWVVWTARARHALVMGGAPGD